MAVLIRWDHQFPETEVRKLNAQLKDIDASRVDGNFLTESGKVASGSDQVSETLRRCLLWGEIVLEKYARVPRLDLAASDVSVIPS